MSRRSRILLIVAGVIGLIVLVSVLFPSEGMNDAYKPQNEFKLDTWINLPGPFDINKAVVYVVIASALTVLTMIYVARRMQQRHERALHDC